jgi:hypothetical protein
MADIITIAIQYGLPTVLLASIAVYHVRVVRGKDIELANLHKDHRAEMKLHSANCATSIERLQEARLTLSQSNNAEAAKVRVEVLELQAEANRSMDAIAAALERLERKVG